LGDRVKALRRGISPKVDNQRRINPQDPFNRKRAHPHPFATLPKRSRAQRWPVGIYKGLLGRKSGAACLLPGPVLAGGRVDGFP